MHLHRKVGAGGVDVGGDVDKDVGTPRLSTLENVGVGVDENDVDEGTPRLLILRLSMLENVRVTGTWTGTGTWTR